MQVEYVSYPGWSHIEYDTWYGFSHRDEPGMVHKHSVWLVPGTFDDNGDALTWVIDAFKNMMEF